MDALNRFDTRTTYRLIRLEYLFGLVVSFYFLFEHLGDIRWWPFAVLFVHIDLIGYIPGAVAYHRSRTKRISRTYYVLYNTMHSMATQAVIALLWGLLVHSEWALLALPIHLCGDRALFGNFLKPFAVNFEPVTHPGFAELEAKVEGKPGSVPVATSTVRQPTAS
ncbi:hypothetical protein ABT330_20200 [Streptomyces sp. NPDC000658]|uniref:hypothetical protein n=1 Tax=Streptomyces sp. NPDC000658 TaxID=3154266 RepID=UPI003326812D